MLCPHCKYPDTSVVYTRHDDMKNHTERRRECLKCGGRFTTHEKLKDPLAPKLDPRGNKIQEEFYAR
jgi:transcriptional repressor NrdR